MTTASLSIHTRTIIALHEIKIDSNCLKLKLTVIAYFNSCSIYLMSVNRPPLSPKYSVESFGNALLLRLPSEQHFLTGRAL